jgi:hypothetical protein
MKHTTNLTVRIAVSLLALLMLLSLSACKALPPDTEALWANATYTRDKSFGKGAVTVEVEVKAGEKAVTFTVKTDQTTLADALLEHNLIAGEDGAYGLYVKSVNGILADYNVDQSYWALFQNGVPLNSGVSGVTIADGEHYELVYTK